MKQFKIIFFFFSIVSFSQIDSTKVNYHFSGTSTVTNNGISLIPSFSLGEPALISIFSIGNDRFAVEPDIRFSLQGKPWSFLLATRYKLFLKTKVKVTTGINYALNYRATPLVLNNLENDYILARRFVGSDLAISSKISKKTTLSLFYLYAHGLEFGTIKNNHFIALSSLFTDISIYDNFRLSIKPQIYELYQNKNNGLFANATFMISNKKIPYTLSYIANKTISSNLVGVKDYIWSINLTYNFNSNFSKK